MWKCPKCGRSFRNDNQHHFCGRMPETIDEYIEEQGEDVRTKLEAVRNILRQTLPDATERIAWDMPTYRGRINFLSFAAAKQHIGIYPGAAVVTHFAPTLDALALKYSKGTIQIPYSIDLPTDLIREIALYARELTK